METEKENTDEGNYKEKDKNEKNKRTEDTKTVKENTDKGNDKGKDKKEKNTNTEETEKENTDKGNNKEKEKKEKNKRSGDTDTAADETDGDGKTKESVLNLEKTSKTVTDGDEVDQVEGGNENCEQKEMDADGQGGYVQIQTSFLDDDDDETDNDMEEQIIGNKSDRDEATEMEQDYAEYKITLFHEGKEDEDLENLMQDNNEEIQRNADDTDADGEVGAGSSRSFTSEYGGNDDDDHNDGHSLKSVSYKSSASASAGTSGYDSERYLSSYLEKLYMLLTVMSRSQMCIPFLKLLMKL